MHLAILLAQAAPEAAAQADSWPGALVAIVSALAPTLLLLVQWLKARDEKQARTAAELARSEAEKQRDAVIDGVEAAADPITKAAIRKTSLERGVAEGLDAAVKTRRLG